MFVKHFYGPLIEKISAKLSGYQAMTLYLNTQSTPSQGYINQLRLLSPTTAGLTFAANLAGLIHRPSLGDISENVPSVLAPHPICMDLFW